MTDVFPALEVSVAAITFVLGFVSARHHAHLAAARDLIQRLSDELEVPTGRGSAGRDRAEDLLLLAESGLSRDEVAQFTVWAAWVWVAAAVVLAVGATLGDQLGGGGAVKAAVAIAIMMLVAGLGTWDFLGIDRHLGELRDRTTVGLLAAAASSIARKDYPAAIDAASLAATRNPRTAWPYAYRARAAVELAARSVPDSEECERLRMAAKSDVRRVIERDPSSYAGLFDWFVDAEVLDLDEELVDELIPLLEGAAWFDAERRLRSLVDGAFRRRILGRRGSDLEEQIEGRLSEPSTREPGTAAQLHWRRGEVAAARAIIDRLGYEEASPIDAISAASILHHLGRHEGALRWIARLLAADPPVEPVRGIAALYASDACRELYRFDEAAVWLERAHREGMDDGVIRLASAILDHRRASPAESDPSTP